MRIVADTTSLSELYKIGHLDVLQSVYGHLIIPEAVFRELQRARALPDLSKKVGQAGWITVCPITRPDVLQALLDRHPHEAMQQLNDPRQSRGLIRVSPSKGQIMSH